MELSTQNQTVLVVEDNPAIREVIRAILESAGYAVVTATDGVEALSALEQRQSNISLLLTDLLMPNMNGLELADRVQELNARLPVLFMAGLSGDEWTPDRELGCVARPFTCSGLIDSVNKALDPQRSPQTIAAHG